MGVALEQWRACSRIRKLLRSGRARCAPDPGTNPQCLVERLTPGTRYVVSVSGANAIVRVLVGAADGLTLMRSTQRERSLS